MMRPEERKAIEQTLLDQRVEWQRRIEAIRADRRRTAAPLDRDLEDQAIELENDETLDALDARGRAELEAIESALERLASGRFGTCVECGEPVSIERLRSRPTATTCIDCASKARAN